MTAITNTDFQQPKWRTIAIFTIAFWLSSSLILDLLIMPALYVSGMMVEPGFAAAGYSIFWIFNRVELLCAALALTAVLVLKHTDSATSTTSSRHNRWALPLSMALFAVAVIYTYGLTPEMGSLGLHLNLFETSAEIPAHMNQMHSGYWLLELFKLSAGGVLLSHYYKQRR